VTPPEPPAVARRLAIRCDGGARIGAGHVARCLPLAKAFAARGWEATFVGRYEGLAAWLLERVAQSIELPVDAPCGLESDRWDAAIVDMYGLATSEICELARRLPIATLGEASRCDSAGMLIDYQLDRIGRPGDARVLAGPAYAPLDPAFAGAGRSGDDVLTVLVTVGGSEQALTHVPQLRELVQRNFPGAELLVPRGNPAGPDQPTRLLDLVGRVDLAVSAAGLTSYELACAGIPQAVVGIVANQSRVVRGLRRSGLAPGVDLSAGESLDQLGEALGELRDLDVRRSLSQRGRATFDGQGAVRAVDGLLACWEPESAAAAPPDGPGAGAVRTAPSLPSTLPSSGQPLSRS
jgi:UDP-2,4-diacetamido-2,4,6-trideoxy-beta-L-altropyranose hydrolase